MSRSLQLGLRTGDLFQTPSVPRSCSGIISQNLISLKLKLDFKSHMFWSNLYEIQKSSNHKTTSK